MIGDACQLAVSKEESALLVDVLVVVRVVVVVDGVVASQLRTREWELTDCNRVI